MRARVHASAGARPPRLPAVAALAVVALAGLAAGSGGSQAPPPPGSPPPSATAGGSAAPAGNAATPPPSAAGGGVPGSPDAVVMAFFDAVNHKDWPRAWQLGGRNLSASYPAMIHGFAQTAHDDVTITATRGAAVQVLLVAEQADGTTRTYHATYQVTGGVIRHGRAALRGSGGRQPADYFALAGIWSGHGRELTINAGGLGIASYRVYQFCSRQQGPPCDSVSGNVIYPGGVTVFQLHGHSGHVYRGTVLDASYPPARGPVTVTLSPAAGSVTVTAGKQGPISYCSPRAKPGACGA